MKQGIIEQAKNVYNGEMFTEPQNAHRGEFWTEPDWEVKVYNMAYMQGCPHVTVESYKGHCVIVSYAVTGVTYSWEWKDRGLAWKWAKERKGHIDGLKAAYSHNYI